MADFTHLHLHTQYSFLDGAIHMGDLAPRRIPVRTQPRPDLT